MKFDRQGRDVISSFINKLAVCVAVAITTVAVPAYAAGDVEAGAKLFRKCQSCHQVGEGARNRTGPHLNELFGRIAGGVDGYRYSDSIERQGADGLVWANENLDVFIENPKSLISGTKMRFSGIKDPEDRANLIAFLRQFSAQPSDIPESAPTLIERDPEVDAAILALDGDPDYGQYLSGECVTCHQLSGGDDGIPSIIGWFTDDFVAAMHAYKNGHRPNPVMQTVANRLSNEEIASLAVYFAALE